MESYARAFKLHESIVFNALVKTVYRNANGTNWVVSMTREGVDEERAFDKVVFAHGYQTQAKMPEFEGQDVFNGEVIHAQKFRRQVGFQCMLRRTQLTMWLQG
jgi:dimethylaniline monooxygenase (N-oxide forming)